VRAGISRNRLDRPLDTYLALRPGFATTLQAETGRDAWLRYQPLQSASPLPAVLTIIGESNIVRTARDEILRGIRGMTGRTLRIEPAFPKESAIVLGNPGRTAHQVPQLTATLTATLNRHLDQ